MDEKTKEKIRQANKGRKRSKKTKRELSLSKIAEKNPNWKGDKVGYNGLHNWIKRRLPKSKICERCKKELPYDCANKGIYNRDLSNWAWLCRKCHMLEDGRLNILVKNSKNRIKINRRKINDSVELLQES